MKSGGPREPAGAPAVRGTMRRASACRTRPAQQLPWPASGSRKAGQPSRRKAGPGTAWRLLFALLAFGVSSCKGVPVMSHVLQGEKVWNEIDGMCSTIPARETLPQPSNVLEEFCFMVLELLQKDKPLVPHPLLPLTPQLHDGRQKRYKADEELRIPGGVQSRGYFMFRDPNEDTEWNDILRDFGILPPKEEVKDEIEEMVLHLQKKAEVKPYEKMNLKQLKEAEDDFDEEDLKAVEMYRKQRLAELKALQKRQRFGELNEISGDQYVKEVTNAPKDVWVVIHLYNASIPMCALVNRHLSLLAVKFPETKFVKAVAKSCIEKYHDNCLPTIFVYKDGKIEGKLIGVVEFGGTTLMVEDLEWKLAEFGAVKTDLEENPRKGIRDMMMSSLRKASIDDK